LRVLFLVLLFYYFCIILQAQGAFKLVFARLL
jgi:hypothetical protein